MTGKEAETNLAISDKRKDEYILKIRELFSAEDKLQTLQCDDSYVERFLYSTDFNVEKAFKKIKLFYELLVECPEWFATGNPLDKKDIIAKDIRILPPVCDKEGRPLYIVKVGNMDANTMDLVKDVVMVDELFIESLLASNPKIRNGLSVILDISNFPWSIIKWLTPNNIKTALRRIHTMPIKEYKYHVVNNSLPIHVAVNIIWPFLPQYVKDSIIFHFNDRNSLYKHIDPDVLPPEYGGTHVMDYKKYHDVMLDKYEQIVQSFKMNRGMYLQEITKFT